MGQIGNADETVVYLDTPRPTTVTEVGAKRVTSSRTNKPAAVARRTLSSVARRCTGLTARRHLTAWCLWKTAVQMIDMLAQSCK